MSRRIAITPRSISEGGHPALAALTAAGYELVFPAPGRMPSEEDLMRDLPHCVGYLAGVEPITRRLLAASPRLRVISRNGSGTDAIDLVAAREHGVTIERATGANARGVAELALALMLDALRHVSWSNAQMKVGRWKRRKGRECAGRTLGVVGCGAIGRTLARFARGLDMTVIGHDPLLNGDPGDPPIPLVPLETLAESADVVSLHCPPAARPLIDAELIGRMREGAALINTARAELIDPAAVLAALESGRLSVYATDVYTSEPPEMTPLLAHPNVILTPHAGGLTDESVERATVIAVKNLIAGLHAAGG